MAQLDEELRERIVSTRALLSPPTVTAQLIGLCEDPEAQIRDVIDVLNTDPALAARLMRLANSPLYARRRRTENLRQAVMLLGFDVVLTASLSLTLTAGRTVAESRSRAFRKRHWTRSVHSAAAAQLLAESVEHVDPSTAFLAALLQDIGVQVVDRIEPETYESCDPGGTHADLVRAEIEQLGADHAAVGALLLDAWSLPQPVVDAVALSHEPGHPEASPVASVVAVGGMVADGFDGQPDCIGRARDAALSLLGVSPSSFAMMLEYLAEVLPDLSVALDADAPDQETLTELAEEAILLRQLKTQNETAQLHDEVESLRNVTEELKTQNGLDPLTGLANRRRLDEIVDQEFVTATRNRFPLSVLFVDLDDFKQVNDRFGHSIGDELLMRTARRISASVRDGDFVARFGGEEFVVVLPGTDRPGSDIVADRLVRAFGDERFHLAEDLVLEQTVSVGVVTLDGSAAYRSASELLHVADLALYAAKRNGKNQFQRSAEGATAGCRPAAEAVVD